MCIGVASNEEEWTPSTEVSSAKGFLFEENLQTGIIIHASELAQGLAMSLRKSFRERCACFLELSAGRMRSALASDLLTQVAPS